MYYLPICKLDECLALKEISLIEGIELNKNIVWYNESKQEIECSSEDVFIEILERLDEIEVDIDYTERDCENCNGEGVYEQLECYVGSASMCCGGCYKEYECEECDNGRITY